MFRKNPKRNFRRRRSESSGEDDQEQVQPGVGTGDVVKPALPACGSARAQSASPSSASADSGSEEAGVEWSAAKRAGQTRICDRSRLSFGCDREEDGEEFKVKKTGNTILFSSHWKKEKQNNVEQAEDISKDEIISHDSIPRDFQKRSGSDEAITEIHTENEEINSTDDETETATLLYQHKMKPVIPSARYIRAVRKKRQMARAQADFIPLHSFGRNGTSPSKLNEEDPSDDELDNHERRIDFTQQLKTQRVRMVEEIGVNESDDESLKNEEEDDDQKLWEQQQIKRVKVFPSPDIETASQPSTHIKSTMLETWRKLPPINLETVKKRLITRLESLQEVYRSHQREHEKIQVMAESSQHAVEHLEASSDSGHRYKFYQEMRTYVRNLTNCFNEKVQELD